MKSLPLLILCAALVAAVQFDSSGSHLPAVLIGMAVIQGTVLLIAAAELSNAKWIAPLKRPLLTFVPLLFLFPFLVKVGAYYGWTQHETRWLASGFFMIRNVVALAALAFVALIYRQRTLADAPSSRQWAVILIFTFVITKTLVAMDWVMSLDAPWISTMFPVLYMIECLYAALSLAGVMCFILTKRGVALGNTLYDTATLFFGFALFWGGLFYAQYLTIWYANIPEEVYYFVRRFEIEGGKLLFYGSIALLFVVPFTTLLIHKARKSAPVFLVLAAIVWLGLLLIRYFHIFPYVQLNPGFAALQLALVLSIIGLTVRDGLRTQS